MPWKHGPSISRRTNSPIGGAEHRPAARPPRHAAAPETRCRRAVSPDDIGMPYAPPAAGELVTARPPLKRGRQTGS